MGDYTVGFITGVLATVLILVVADDIKRLVRREIARVEAEKASAALDAALAVPEKKGKLVA